ncbi:MAG: acyl-CoA dehydrogenase [Alphaproteobacteria bacterium]|nr:MAG: acyl-CoA dehydrogenase [Alphaproteobacteria bacterium]
MPALPIPGAGDTLSRWRILASIASSDLCLVKVLEAHYDAAAILQEIGDALVTPGELWAVWAAEPPGLALEYTETGDGCGVIHGTKAWCSGANLVSHALITTRTGEMRQLVQVDLRAAGISDPAESWPAVGMSRVVSGSLVFDGTPARRIGEAGAYLARPGFWHGGAGIAACWFGGAQAIAETLRVHAKAGKDPHASAHLGVVDTQLTAGRALLRELAAKIDRAPQQAHMHDVILARSFIERIATETLDRVGRALGAGPLCTDRAHAVRCADLTVFLRQSHAERDWAALGIDASTQEDRWTL